ncbi:MAG TPA: GNAT family N-acetyltransferase [Candidatus Paceibacterota bacterium]|nr:GNAT family N-acetyltransferase [Candidatus Paceibacterota bacterium]
MKQNLLELKIETGNLILRPVSVDDRDSIFKEFTAEITHFMNPVPPVVPKDTEKFINDSRQKMENGEEIVFSIFDKSTGEFLGGCGMHHINTPTPEPGIWIKKSAHGHGYGREAVTALKKWADENLNYEYLVYPAFKENIASRKIPESLGGRIEREVEKKNGAGVPMISVEYRIYKN